ncbi:hypothetical protein PHLGIDRAFT_425315 [Phlebiopsis gigantea 11061_1 CR5-6]|uniref:Uncharacterized protein n=1 Tax=Phlebiopsis gigantea (strain 11061_1 CR5-6) TaxID=745531 RepID=A0A0C3RYM4_PHLG1|nr:hypothetical protein PHLGIDRAFT_425315 [Phlebiopsis gigantea 11061_1 CR5-6]
MIRSCLLSTPIFVFPAPKARTQHRRDSVARPVTAPTATAHAAPTRAAAGQSSGKRTLAEVMEHDMASKRQRRKERELPSTPPRHLPQTTRSKFFAGASSSRPKGHRAAHATSDTESVAGPSSGLGHDKENIPSFPSEDELDESETSMDEAADPVTQEDGYMSPSPSFSRWDSPELSSPLRPRRATPSQSIAVEPAVYLDEDEDIDDFDAEVLSSPPGPPRRRNVDRHVSRMPFPSAGNVLVHGTPTPSKKRGGRAASPEPLGPDLRDMFEYWSDRTSDIDEDDGESMESAASSSEPVTPESSGQRVVCVDDGCCEEQMTNDLEEMKTEPPAATRDGRTANGWWERWACPEAIPTKEQSVRVLLPGMCFVSRI